jgi:hypothetical protein
MSFSDGIPVFTLVFWYHVGIIWLVQVVAWPLFGYVGRNEFEAYHAAWWRGIRYVIFVPSGLALLGMILLLHSPPLDVPVWLLWTALGLYILTYGLTAVWWGPQQAKLIDTKSPRFGLILRTHWIRTVLVAGFAVLLLTALVVRMRA